MKKPTLTIAIRPIFWIFAALIGFINSFSLPGTLVWIVIIFISVLFHEFGHALMAIIFRKTPRIELVAFGGFTAYDPRGLSSAKQFLIVLNGPTFGFLLFFIADLLLKVPQLSTGGISIFLAILRIVNLFWTVVNLLPIVPLDGGQLLRIFLEAIFGFKGVKFSQAVGAIFSFGLTLVCVLYQSYLFAAIFFLFAFQCFMLWKKASHLTKEDTIEENRSLFEEAQEEIKQGHTSLAKDKFSELLSKAHKGIIASNAAESLAFLKMEEQNWKEIYELLNPIQSDLSIEGLCLLQKAAFFQKDFTLVDKISGICFQYIPTAEVALYAAYASASLQKKEAAIGWLKTSLENGLSKLEKTLEDPVFDLIRNDREFKKLFEDQAD